jgi:hypothetical protein
MALTARQSGWTVRQIAAEPWLQPAQFMLSGPDRAGLRPAPLASAAPPAHVRSNEIAPAAAAWQRMAMRPPAFPGAQLRKEL